MRKGTISILSTITGAVVGASAGAFGVQKTMGESKAGEKESF